MLSNGNRSAILMAAMVVCLGAACTRAAMASGWPSPEPNYYVPAATGDYSAAMYPSPRPVPPYVGMTYISYEPLAPAQFMYPHIRSFVRCNEDGGSTRTTVTWGHHFTWHPSLRVAEPALHTPASSGRCSPQ